MMSYEEKVMKVTRMIKMMTVKGVRMKRMMARRTTMRRKTPAQNKRTSSWPYCSVGLSDSVCLGVSKGEAVRVGALGSAQPFILGESCYWLQF